VSKLRPTGEEPVRNLERKDKCATGTAFNEFWNVYPKLKDREKSEALFRKAVGQGIEPRLIISAAEEYCRENASNGYQYLCYSDNWLDQRRWENQRSARTASATGGGSSIEDTARMLAEKIQSGSYVPSSAFTSRMTAIMLRLELVSVDQLQRIGVAV